MRRLLLLVPALLVVVAASAGCDPGASPADSPAPRTASADPVPAPAGGAASFLDFAEGGAAPRFDDQVDVSVGGRVVLTLTRDEAADPRSWTAGGGPLLGRATTDWRREVPAACGGLPSPVGPPVRHQVDARGVSVLWRPHVCDFAVRLLLDRSGAIAAVAFDGPAPEGTR